MLYEELSKSIMNTTTHDFVLSYLTEFERSNDYISHITEVTQVEN